MTESEAVEWLAARNIHYSLRTLRDMRARSEIAFYKLKRGTPKVRFTEAQLEEAFVGGEVRPLEMSQEPQRRQYRKCVKSGLGGDEEFAALFEQGRLDRRLRRQAPDAASFQPIS